MDTLINILLLLVSFAGALTAFTGDTLNKNAATVYGRITRVGWFSILLLLIAFNIGIWKELREQDKGKVQEAKAKEQYERAMRAEQQLAIAQAKIDALKPAVVKAVSTMTQDIPKEYDDGFMNLNSQPEAALMSNRSKDTLKLYGGDDFEYHCYCGNGSLATPASVSGLYLKVGTRGYPLESNGGTWRIAGPAGQALEGRIINPGRAKCDIKYIVRSTVRTRSKQQLTDALQE